jgi:hypothetical protein
MKSFDTKSSINGAQEHAMYQVETGKKGKWNGFVLKEKDGKTVQRRLPNTTYTSFMGTVRRLFSKKMSQRGKRKRKTTTRRA